MPVGVEQWRAAVGVMARSAAPKPRSPIGPHWNKWLKASDPAVYKGCVVLLVTIAQLVSSGLDQVGENTEEMVKEGSEAVCRAANRGKTRVLGMRARPSAVLATSLVSHMVILLCGHILRLYYRDASRADSDEWYSSPAVEKAVGSSDCVWSRLFGPVQVGSVILLPPLSQLSLSVKHFWEHNNGKPFLKKQMKPLQVCLYRTLLCLGQWLNRCLWFLAWLVYRKCSKKTVVEDVGYLVSLLFSNRKGPGLSEVAIIVFVNQMLLMIAGDVERNPGPDTITVEDLATLVNELHDVRDKWYHLGIQLNMKTSDLNAIRTQYMNNPDDCLLDMLSVWLSRIDPSPPTWQRVVAALTSQAIGKHSAAERIQQVYCKACPSKAPDPCSVPCETLKAKIVSLEKAFAKLRIGVYRLIRNEPVDVIIAGLLAMDVNGQEHHVPFLTEITQDKKTVLEVWVKLSPYLNFLNYEILQHILFNFSDDNLQREMEDYESKMEEFFQGTRLCDFLDSWPVRGKTPPVEQLCDFVVKHKKDWNTCTLRDLDLLEKSLARKLFLPTFAVILNDASPGCVSVTFSVPASMVPQLQSVIRETELKEFVDMEIETVTVDGVVVYEAPLLQYTSLLKRLYTSRSPLQPLPGSKPKPLLPFRLARIDKHSLSPSDMDRFTRESLRGDMDDVVLKKTAMELSELGVMGDDSQPQVTLIEGAPGVGKTTFAWHQCRLWAEGSLLQAYSIVLLLPLRDNNIRQISSLSTLFQHSQRQVREEVSRRVAESGGAGCLIWLEAWDELPDHLRSHSLFTQLIQGFKLPSATIFITTRPWATGDLLATVGDRLSQRIELLALAREEVENETKVMKTTIHSLTGFDSGFDFLTFVESNPVIHAAMYTPVSAAIVEQVFKTAPHNPPITVTGLYSAYILMRLEQHLSEHPEYSGSNIQVRTLADLPEGVLGDLQQLCRLAYEGVSQQMIVFSSLPTGVSTLDLLETVPQVYDEGEDRVSYNFLHYTVQEYLAALHLSFVESQHLLKIVNSRMRSKSGFEVNSFKTTFEFLAGITKLETSSVDFLSDILERDAPTVYRWLYESQNQYLLTSVLGSGGRRLSLSFYATNVDYFAAGYCLIHSNSTWNLDFDYISVDDTAVEFFSKGCNNRLTKTGISSRLISASFIQGSITAKGLKHFLTIPNSLLQCIQQLAFSRNQFDKRACEILAEAVLEMPYLYKLSLMGNTDIGRGGAVQLFSSLHNSSLKELNMFKTNIGGPDFESLANYIRVTASLEELWIGWNKFSVHSLDLLCKALSANSSMRILDMRGCCLTLAHCTCVGELLRNPVQCQLKELVLSWCGLTVEGLREIIGGLCENQTLKELILSYTQIRSVDMIATMLKINTSLEKLDLGNCSIGSSGGIELGEALVRNEGLRYLRLSGNELGDDGVRGLCVGLEKNTSLEELELEGDQLLGEDGVSLLLNCVENTNTGLRKIRLPQKFWREISNELLSKCVVSWLVS